MSELGKSDASFIIKPVQRKHVQQISSKNCLSQGIMEGQDGQLGMNWADRAKFSKTWLAKFDVTACKNE